jgi:hypothetical protein
VGHNKLLAGGVYTQAYDVFLRRLKTFFLGRGYQIFFLPAVQLASFATAELGREVQHSAQNRS